MSFPTLTARYYKKWSDWYHRDISYPQLLVLHVAANYKLRPSGTAWWADVANGLTILSDLAHHLQ